MAYNAPSSKGRPLAVVPPGNEILPGYDRFRKTIDFGNAATNCFDFEEALSFLCSPVVKDTKGRKGLIASPVYIVDPCQAGQTPLKIQTILTAHAARSATDLVLSTGLAGVYLGRENVTEAGFSVDSDYSFQSFHTMSALNTAQTINLRLRNLAQMLAIHMATSAGTATLTISGTTDSGSALQLDSIALAAATDLQYTPGANVLNGVTQAGTSAGTGASTVKLNPLAFDKVTVTAGAAGAGNTTTLDVAVK